MDMFSRFSRFYPLRDMFATSIADTIITHCCHLGFPKLIFTDAASNLSAALANNIFLSLNISHAVSIPYRHNPSMVERVHYPLKKSLSILCRGAIASWPRYLDKVTYALNTTFNGSLGCSPMEAFFFRQINPQPNLGDLSPTDSYDGELVKEMDHLRKQLIDRSVDKKTEYVDNRNKLTKTPPNLSIGDKVMIKKELFSEGINRKMQPIRTGPWKVDSVAGTEIHVSLVESPSVTRRRHISHLAPFVERPPNLLRKTNWVFPPQVSPLVPNTITGDFNDPIFLSPNSIIISGTECMLRKAGGLSSTLLRLFPYGSPYSAHLHTTCPTNDILHNLLRHRPLARRTPGLCILKFPKTRTRGPGIANLTIQYCPGRAVDDQGVQNDYTSKHGDFTNQSIIDLLLSDTRQSRITWFETALRDLKDKITLMPTPPRKVYIPKHIACGYSAGSHETYWPLIQNFAAHLDLSGIELIAVQRIGLMEENG